MRHILKVFLPVVGLLCCLLAHAADSVRLTLTASPAIAGTFNLNTQTTHTTGETIELQAYTNSSFTFIHWTDENGNVLSENMHLKYTMPSNDCRLTAVYEYDPANPGHPSLNYWKAATGEVIIDTFKEGKLQDAIYETIGDTYEEDVTQITVAGVMDDNDFGIINTYSQCLLLDLSRVTGITYIPSYAFDYTGLEQVYLPATIESIGTAAFSNCSALSALTIYATTPPELSSNVFIGASRDMTVYVPAAAMALYTEATGWKDFLIMPIQEDIRTITVSLPDNVKANDYNGMWLELTNNKSGQRIHYVMTERNEYTFAGIIRNTLWNIVLRNERGDIFGQIDNINVQDEDVTVQFATLSKPQKVSLAILTPQNENIAEQSQITWTDASGNYIGQGTTVSTLPIGLSLKAGITLPQQYTMLYIAPQTISHTVSATDNNITCSLNAIPQAKISGKVKDSTTGLPLNNVVISASQTFGGKYSQTTNTQTRNDGAYTLDVYCVPTTMTFATNYYVAQTLSIDTFTQHTQSAALPDIALTPLTGITLDVSYTYTPCTANGETPDVQHRFADYSNVTYTLYNITRQKEINSFNVQYPQIVLQDGANEGDEIRVIASSLNGRFMPVEQTVTIENEKASVTFDIVELGGIKASYLQSENEEVAASLYDKAGKLIKTYNYILSSLTINNLPDGQYTLVSMGKSRLFNTVYDLQGLSKTGLKAGSDYVRNTVNVQSGHLTEVNISEIPLLDESKLYYTGNSTSFTVNKPEIVIGNYLTLSGHIDFKAAYAPKVTNVQLLVNLPDASSFVENSVMVGNGLSSYTLNGSQLTIPVEHYSDRIRFCIVPTESGNFAPSALVQFDIDGNTITQPIGAANYTAKNLSISVPSIVATTSVPVSGTANGNATIEIYDNDVLVGRTTSTANGQWKMNCSLNQPYNLSRHKIYARITNYTGQTFITEAAECLYDRNNIEVKTVTMSFYNGWLQQNVEVVFDFNKYTTNASSYMFYSATDFTFITDLTNNSPDIVKSVALYVYTDQKQVKELQAAYDKKTNRWIAKQRFEYNNLPINISVDIQTDMKETEPDSAALNSLRDEYMAEMDSIDSIDNQMRVILEEIKEEIQNSTQSDENITQLLSLYNTLSYKLFIDEYIPEPIDAPLPNEDEFNKLFDDYSPLKLDELIKNCADCGPFYDHDKVNKYVEQYENKTTNKKGTIESRTTEDGTKTPKIEYDFTKNEKSKDNPNYQPEASFKPVFTESENNSPIVTFRNKDGDEITYDFTDVIPNNSGQSFQQIVNDVCDSYLEQWNILHTGTFGLDLFDLELEAMIRGVTAENKFLVRLLAKAWNKADAYGRVDIAVKLLPDIETNQMLLTSLRGIQKTVNYANIAIGAISTGIDGYQAYRAYNDWDDIIKRIRQVCDQTATDSLVKKAEANKLWIGRRKTWKTVGTAGTTAIGIAGMYGGPAGWGVTLTSLGIGMGLGYWETQYNRTDNNNKNNMRQLVRRNCNAELFPEEEDATEPKFRPLSPILDPSGYVYEAVPSNRVEGVTATIYYKETVEDMYGDLHENIVKWDAEEYAQQNPLFTDENGMYRWDVPQGLWQVRFEKDGYETAYSDWLPVPPPQLDVNIAISQNRQPEVKMAIAYEDAVEMEFDKYMMPEYLTTDEIIVLENDNPVQGTITLLNTEENTDAQTFASKVRFNADQPFTAKEITLMVSSRVRSYAGIRMQDDFKQSFTIEQEIKEIDCDVQTTIGYGKHKRITVSVLPASAASGRILEIISSSDIIVSVDNDEITLDKDGKAYITIYGELPGMAALTFMVKDTYKTATTLVSVDVDYTKTVAAPISSIESGSEVRPNTEVYLSSETENAEIWYTTDGSSPLDGENRLLYDGSPIIISHNVTIHAIAVAEDMTPSDISEFVFTVSLPTTIVESKTKDADIVIFPLPVQEILNITTDKGLIHSVTLSTVNGIHILSLNPSSVSVSIPVKSLPEGVYVVLIKTSDSTYSRKVIKVK